MKNTNLTWLHVLSAILMQETCIAKYVIEVLSHETINAQDVFTNEMNFNAACYTEELNSEPEEVIIGEGTMKL